jgi:hypothetical protein
MKYNAYRQKIIEAGAVAVAIEEQMPKEPKK